MVGWGVIHWQRKLEFINKMCFIGICLLIVIDSFVLLNFRKSKVDVNIADGNVTSIDKNAN